MERKKYTLQFPESTQNVKYVQMSGKTKFVSVKANKTTTLEE